MDCHSLIAGGLGDIKPRWPYGLVRPSDGHAPILFASPHSGRYYPKALRDRLRVPLIDLQRTEDAFVDELFSDVAGLGGTLMFAQYARAYVDLNRDARELDAAMFADGLPRRAAVATPRVRAGLGCLPRIAARGEEIYAVKLQKAEGEARLGQVHDIYHQALNAELDALKGRYGTVILIDCHSMPSTQPGRHKLPDIVLGDRFGSSCENGLTRLAERSFRQLGYSVGRNAPYAGGYTTRRYGRPQRKVHALQIEIRRDLYLDELTVQKSTRFGPMRNDIARVCKHLIARAQEMAR